MGRAIIQKRGFGLGKFDWQILIYFDAIYLVTNASIAKTIHLSFIILKTTSNFLNKCKC